jgi:glycosyltransferase involved in cell wall biosynthesis
MKKRHITCFIKKANVSGACKLTIQLFERFNSDQFDKRLIFFQYEPQRYRIIAKELKSAGIRYIVIKKVLPDFLVQFYVFSLLDQILVRLIYPILAKLKLTIIMLDQPYDIIYSNIDQIIELPGFFEKFSYRYYHLYVNGRTINHSPSFAGKRIENLNRATRVIAGSSDIRHTLEKKGVNSDVLSEMGCSIRPFEVTPKTIKQIRKLIQVKDNDFIIGGCGSFSDRKGTDIFFEIAGIVDSLEQNENVKFVWVGDGKLNDISDNPVQQRNLEEIRQKLGERLHITGFVPNAYEYFSAFDLFIVSSRSEGGFPTAMLENMSLGNSIVAFSEIAKGSGKLEKYIYQVEEITAKAMAKVVCNLINNETLLKKNRQRIQECVFDHFNTDKRANRLEQLFLQKCIF